MTSTPNGNGKTFLDIPTQKGLKTAFVVIVIFMALAGGLYCFAGKGPKDYAAKVGDTFIQGAIVSILFAILKAMIDKVWPFSAGSTNRQQQHAPAASSAARNDVRDCVRQRVPWSC